VTTPSETPGEAPRYPIVIDPTPWDASTAEDLEAAEEEALAAIRTYLPRDAYERLLAGLNYRYDTPTLSHSRQLESTTNPELSRLVSVYQSIRRAASLRRW
jgi:hypothetical protein